MRLRSGRFSTPLSEKTLPLQMLLKQFVCFMWKLLSLVWSGRGSAGKRWCHIFLCTNQDCTAFESESDYSCCLVTVSQMWWNHTHTVSSMKQMKSFCCCFVFNVSVRCTGFEAKSSRPKNSSGPAWKTLDYSIQYIPSSFLHLTVI